MNIKARTREKASEEIDISLYKLANIVAGGTIRLSVYRRHRSTIHLYIGWTCTILEVYI